MPRWPRVRLEWRIEEFCLVESRLATDGTRYSVVDRWSANDDMK
jgi:2'-5' RNA ligase